jgi:signal transduction histidine kinase
VTRPDGQGEPLATLDFASLFASNIHEIKNQLFLLLSAVEEVSRETWVKEHASAQMALNRLDQGGAQIAQQLAHLLGLYRIAQGYYQLDIAYHEAAELMQDVALEIRPLLGEQRAAELIVEGGEALYGFFDREIVRGILLNAVHNALRFSAGKVRISAARDDGFLCFQVEDDGPGFPPEMLAEGVAQARLDLRRGGTGLGLYFAATTAALHHSQGKKGFIRLANNGAFLKGAVFKLCLP